MTTAIRALWRWTDDHSFLFLAILQAIAVFLKLTRVMSSSWWIVLIPAWLAVALVLAVLVCFLWYALS